MAINTYGWDIVYAMKYQTLNETLQSKFNSEAKLKKELRYELSKALAEAPYKIDTEDTSKDFICTFGASHKAQKGKKFAYSKPFNLICHGRNGKIIVPSPTESIPLKPTHLKPLLKVVKVNIEAEGTGERPQSIEFLGGKTNAKGTISSAIKKITLTNAGTGYQPSHTEVKITPSDKGAQAKADFDESGKLIGITLLNSGSGYDSVPTIEIIDKEDLGAGAHAIAELGFVVGITDEGSGYNQWQPTLEMKNSAGNIITRAGFQYTLYMSIEDYEGGQLESEVGGIAPLYTIERATDDKGLYYDTVNNKWVDTSEVDWVFPINVYKTPKHIYNNNDIVSTNLKSLFAEAVITFIKLSKTKNLCSLSSVPNKNSLSVLLSNAVTTDKVFEKLEEWSKAAVDYWFSCLDVANFNPELEIIQKWQKLKPQYDALKVTTVTDEKIIENALNPNFNAIDIVKKQYKDSYDYLKYNKEVDFILTKRAYKDKYTGVKESNIKALIQDWITEEKNRMVRRLKRSLRTIDASLVFDYNASVYESSDLMTFAQLPAANSDNVINMYIYNIIEVAMALLPENYSDKIIGLGEINDEQAFKLQKIRLYTDAWQLTLSGGDTKNMYIKVPIQYGVCYFNKNKPFVIRPTDKYYIKLKVNLLTIQDANVTSFAINKDTLEVVKVAQEENAPAIVPYLTANNKLILERFIEQTLNNARYTKNLDQSSTAKTYKILDPVDDTYMYNHTFAELDILEHIASDDATFAWMYPTSATYVIQDEQHLNPDVNNSIFGICAMTNGRKQPSADLDRAIIPNNCDAVVAIGKECLLQDIFMPYFSYLYTYEDGKDISIDDAFSKPNGYTYKNTKILKTKSLGILNQDKSAIEVTIPIGSLIIMIDDNVVSFSYNDVSFKYKKEYNPGWQFPTKHPEINIKASVSFSFKFGFDDKKQLQVYPEVLKHSDFKPDYVEMEEDYWGSLLTDALVGFTLGVLVGLAVMGASAGRKYYLKNKKNNKVAPINNPEEAAEEVRKNTPRRSDVSSVELGRIYDADEYPFTPRASLTIDAERRSIELTIIKKTKETQTEPEKEVKKEVKENVGIWKQVYKEVKFKEACMGLAANLLTTGLYTSLTQSSRRKKYDVYKQSVDDGLNNTDKTAIDYLTNNFCKKIKWPAFASESIELRSCKMEGAFIIGLGKVEKKRLLQHYVSLANPVTPMVKLAKDITQITIENIGDNPVNVCFVQNKDSYEGLLEKKISKDIQVLAHSTKVIPIEDFDILDKDHAMLWVESMMNDTKFNISIH